MPAKILLVEDDTDNIFFVTRLLERNKYEVVSAPNKEAGIAAALSEKPDLILMDISMPNKEGESPNPVAGLEATKETKSKEEAAGIPIIALTARAMVQEKARIKEAGCDAIQSKPIEFDELLGALKQFLPSHEQNV